MKNFSRRTTRACAIALLSSLAAACGPDPILGYGEADAVPPTVIAVFPASNASDVPVGTTVSATFSEPMQPIDAGATFTVTCSAPCSNPAGTVALNGSGTVATFTPASDLQPFTLYTATVDDARSQGTGLAMQAPFTWQFTTGTTDTTRPQVIFTVPATTSPALTNVSPNTPVTATFSEDMAPASILAPGTFTLTCASPCVSPAGNVSYSTGTRTASFGTFASLTPGATYTATITTAATDLAGNALAGNQAPLPGASNYVWTFTVAESASAEISVASTSPVSGAENVCPDSSISATFNVPVGLRLNPATVNGSTFTVRGPGFTSVTPSSITLDNATGRTVTFTPQEALINGVLYTATLVGGINGVRDEAGHQMNGNYNWTFRGGPATGACAAVDTDRPHVISTVPVTTNPGPTPNVSANTTVSATFSEDMAPASITTPGTFTLTCQAPCSAPAGTVTYAPGTRTATYGFAGSLTAGATYTATITTAATDLAGNALGGNQAAPPAASNYVWTFTVAGVPLPTNVSVAFTTPVAGAIDVCPNATISATFNVPSGTRMDPATINATNFTLTGPGQTSVTASSVVLDNPTGRTATFTPQNALTDGVIYTATIRGGANGVKDLANPANQMNGNFSWSFTAGPATGACLVPDTTRPRVSFTVPATTNPGPTMNVPTNTAITATFTEDMLPPTIVAAGTFTIACNAPCTSPTGVVTYVAGSRTAVFTPDAVLLPSTTYTATITTAATDLAGNALAGNQAPLPGASNYVWTFRTGAAPDTTRPRVTSTVPATTNPGPTPGVAINTAITAAFTEDMAPATIVAAGTFTVTCSAPCTSPAGTVTYVAASRTAVFTPNSDLDSSTTYTARITTAAEDLAGNALAGNQAPLPAASDYVWTFTTGAAPDTTRPRVTVTVPATTSPGPTPNVATNTDITATFTEDMAPLTIDETSFTLSCVNPCVAPVGVVTYAVGAKTATYSAADLAPSTTYTATVTKFARDLAGNRLAGNQAPLPAASNYVWTFTTAAAPDLTPPTVTATNPVNGAVGVCINKTINATFSEAMKLSTITAANFTLEVTGGVPVTGLVGYDAVTHIATFDPGSDLIGTPATNYTATIKGGVGGVEDLAGNPMAVDKVTTFTTNASTCTEVPPLGAAAPFGSFGGTATITNDGLNTVINGDIGVAAASTSITGFRDSGGNVYTVTPDNDGLVNGLVYTLTAPPGSVPGEVVTEAKSDAQIAFDSISPGNLPGGIDMSSLAQCPSCGGAGGGPDELSGRTLPPGIYKSSTGSFDLGGPARGTASLTLDAGGDANAVWIFQSAAGTGTLNIGLTGPTTPAVPMQVQLINGAQPKNVFWYAPAGATIGTAATVAGTILADASITISTTGGSPPTAVLTTLNGRAIALTAAVTMTNTVVNVPAP